MFVQPSQQEKTKYNTHTWTIVVVVALEKLKLLNRCSSGSILPQKPCTITVFAVPCSPISKTALPCFDMRLRR